MRNKPNKHTKPAAAAATDWRTAGASESDYRVKSELLQLSRLLGFLELVEGCGRKL